MAGFLELTREAIVETAVDEAIHRLAHVNPRARAALISMLKDDQGFHPRTLCTAYRKAGEQLTREELKSIGLRANAFMSRLALAEITAAGMSKPLEAHTLTLLRAFFTYARWRTLQAAEAHVREGVFDRDALRFSYDVLPPVCNFCSQLDGEPTTPATAYILPPSECECETANYSIRMRVDYLHGLD